MTESKELITKKDADELTKQRQNLSKWLIMAHDEPEKVCVNKFAKNTKYVPISYIEMKLDELFFDGWNLEIKSYELVLNSIVVSVRITGLNPATGREFYRDGIGSKAIQLNSNSKPMDISNIKSNGLELAFPAAKAQAFKNAAQSIGKVFGRDISREIQDEYNPIVKPGDNDDLSNLCIKWDASKKDQASLNALIAEAQKLKIANDFIEYAKENK